MTTTEEKTITELLHELNKTMTDKALALELGVSGQTIYRWRNGRTQAPMPKLVRERLVEILAR